jgi:multisubunit Na+/H+ antiporter MnhE subunit
MLRKCRQDLYAHLLLVLFAGLALRSLLLGVVWLVEHRHVALFTVVAGAVLSALVVLAIVELFRRASWSWWFCILFYGPAVVLAPSEGEGMVSIILDILRVGLLLTPPVMLYVRPRIVFHYE